MIEEIQLAGRHFTLVGTAHISQASIDEVERVIEEVKPDSVAIELCAARYDSIQNQDQWKNMDIIKVVKEGKAPLLMANLILSAYQRRMGEKLGVKPGAEMLQAIKIGNAVGAKLHLADRNVAITLKRAWTRLSLWKKAKLMSAMIFGGFDEEEITTEEVEKLKEKDMLTEAIETLANEMPEIKEVLIDERDLYLSQEIKNSPGDRVVAVVGAGHLPGILQHFNEEQDLEALKTTPPPSIWGKVFKWGLPMAITAVIAYGFTFMDGEVSTEMIKRWVLANGILSALGALIAGGHILTVLSAFVAAPITSLNPTIAAGWVSGLTEAWVRKPKVEDFENLSVDLTSFAGFRKNEITKILLVVILSNIGSSLGTFVGIPLITSLL